MRIYTERPKIKSEWEQGRILRAMQAYSLLNPKPRKSKRPDMDTSSTGKINVKLRNSQGVLLSIYGETTKAWWQMNPARIKKHSIKVKSAGIEPQPKTK